MAEVQGQQEDRQRRINFRARVFYRSHVCEMIYVRTPTIAANALAWNGFAYGLSPFGMVAFARGIKTRQRNPAARAGPRCRLPAHEPGWKNHDARRPDQPRLGRRHYFRPLRRAVPDHDLENEKTSGRAAASGRRQTGDA